MKNQINKSDLITTDGYLSFCNENNITYFKTDYFYNGQFIWRGKIHPDPDKRLGDVCVIGHSDYPVNSNISKKFKYVFCVNKVSDDNNTFGIPLGISNDTDESPAHRICGNKDVFIDIMETNINKKNLAYINFTLSTFISERKLVFDMFSNENWVKVGKTETTWDGNRKYLMDIKSSKFVFCPRGNGVDTHRLWESLYMGSIPIVKYESTHHLFKDLPILFVNEWNEINEDFLNKKYIEIINKKWNLDKLKISYWENMIKNKI
jgi:hypothetical protein